MIELFRKYPDVVSVEQVAEMLHLSLTIIYRLLRSGDIKAKKVGTRYIITKKSVIDFINAEE